MPDGMAPTRIQQRVLDHIAEAVRERGSPPTFREIAARFNWKVGTAQDHVKLLLAKGLLEREPGIARGLRIAKAAARFVARTDGIRTVPLVGAVPAGQPIDAVENLEGTIGIDPALFPQADVFALRVKGASMVGAGIRDGDIALVRQTQEANDGDIVVAQIDDEATLKRLVRKNGKVVLHAENPAFKDVVVKPGADFALAGVVIGIVRKMW